MRLNKDEQAFADLLEGLRADAPEEMAKLAHLANALEHVRPTTGPSPAFRNQLRNRLIAETAARRSWIDRFAEQWAERNARMRRNFRFVFAAGLATLVMLTSGAVFAVAGTAVPGDWDYFAKRWREDARLLVTRSPEARGYLQMELARERVDEIRELVSRGSDNADLYRIALNDMDARTLDATKLLVGVYRQSARTKPLERLTSFAVAQSNALEVMVEKMPPAARPGANDSLDILRSVSNRVTGIMGGCLCPANALLPQTSSGSGSDDSADDSAAPQAPQCACSRFRSQDTSTQPDGMGTTGPSTDNTDQTPPKSSPSPVLSPPDLVPGSTVDDEVVDTVNDVIDDTLNTVLGDDPIVELPTGGLLP